jgi:hypothetical protein
MAADVALFVENGLNRVLVSNRGWEGWGNLPGRWLMTVAGVGSGGGDRQCAGCSGNATGVVGGSKVVTWQRWNRGFRIWDATGRGTGRWSHNHLNVHR